MKDLTDQIFGKLIAIERDGTVDKYGKSLWYCLCECGNTTHATSNHLTSGNKKSCGCLTKTKPNFINLTGKRFGKWTVLSRSPNRYNHTYWNTVCNCGRPGNVSSSALRKGTSKGCQKCQGRSR